jgi:hypothetical protein
VRHSDKRRPLPMPPVGTEFLNVRRLSFVHSAGRRPVRGTVVIPVDK